MIFISSFIAELLFGASLGKFKKYPLGEMTTGDNVQGRSVGGGKIVVRLGCT